MKTYVITVSRQFPKTHCKAGTETNFVSGIVHFEKMHTIRGNYELWKKRFDNINAGKAALSLRYWEEKPYRSKQIEFLRLTKNNEIGFEKLISINFDEQFAIVKDDENALAIDLENIAHFDGLKYGDFKEWFKNYDNKPMAIIHFTRFRYCNTNY